MDRRYFLKHTTSLPFLLFGSQVFSQPTAPIKNKKILILIELRGGNDGLNTLAPYSQSNYYKLRPNLAISKNKLIQLPQKPGIGLHPELKNLAQLILNKQTAVLQGVGYPDPSLSHFRSMDIWHTAKPEEDLATEGWLNSLISYQNQQAVSFSDELGGFEGNTNNVFVIDSKRLKNKKKNNHKKKINSKKTANWILKKDKRINNKNQAISHILDVEKQINKLETVLQNKGKADFDKNPLSPFQRQIKALLQIVSSPQPISLFKIHLQGFDTHKNQLKQHGKLLKDLDTGISFLAKYLKQLNLWNQTLILTYSEFGRRIKENKSQGTDHGTANVHFATGGLVRPGFYGQEPVIKMTEQNLPFYLDFRSIYATILKEQFGLSDTESPLVKKFYKPSNSFLKV